MHRAFTRLIAVTLATVSVFTGAAAQSRSPDILTIDAVIERNTALIACGLDAVWAVGDGQLVRVNPGDNSVVNIEIPTNDIGASLVDIDRFRGIVVGEGAVWLPDIASSTIFKIDPLANQIMLSIGTDIFGARGSIGVGEGAVWVITFENRDKTLTRYSAASGAEEAKIALPKASNGVIAAFGSVWVTAANAGEVYRIDPSTNQVAEVISTQGPSHLVAASSEAIWISLELDGLVQKIDADSGVLAATINTNVHDSTSDGSITVGGGFIWTMTRFSTVVRIDPATNSVTGVYVPAQGTPMGRRFCYGSGALWISGPSMFKVSPPE